MQSLHPAAGGGPVPAAIGIQPQPSRCGEVRKQLFEQAAFHSIRLCGHFPFEGASVQIQTGLLECLQQREHPLPGRQQQRRSRRPQPAAINPGARRRCIQFRQGGTKTEPQGAGVLDNQSLQLLPRWPVRQGGNPCGARIQQLRMQGRHLPPAHTSLTTIQTQQPTAALLQSPR